MPAAPTSLPTGTVTFLFTDVEGSTQLLNTHPDAYRHAIRRHHDLLLEAVETNHGAVFETVGDAVYAAFYKPTDAVRAALQAQLSLHREVWGPAPIKVRIGLHLGEVELQGDHYFGAPLYRCARLMSAAHGGQTVISESVAAAVRDSLPDGAIADLREHHLKDLARPEHIWQLNDHDLPRSFPALRTLDSLPNNLPRQLTSFVGREKELAEAKRLLARSPLLTLTGTGGCGKTRLALQTGADLADAYPDGVWLTEFAPLAGPELVPATVASALGVREVAGVPILQTLLEFLRSKHLLLILDNCEHLIDACARLVDAAVHAAPRVQVLATSREALGIAGEVSWRAPSLPVPDSSMERALAAGDPAALQALSHFEAVRLFIDRAVAALPEFTVTNQNAPALAQLCQRLDGVPLALELAAARVKALSVEQIATRLDQRFRLLTGGSRTALPRQQTLAALVAWSYDLLSAPERTLFNRLSIFAGRFLLEDAEVVCAGESIDSLDVLDLLARLVEKSLALAEPGPAGAEQYRLLETLRQYGREQLLAAGEAESLHSRHAAHFLDLGKQAQQGLISAALPRWLLRLEPVVGNLRAALRWALEHDEVAQAFEVLGGMNMLWYYRGHPAEGRAWIDELLASPPALGRTALRAGLLRSAALLSWNQGDSPTARVFILEAVAIARETMSTRILANALMMRAFIEVDLGNLPVAASAAEEAMSLSAEDEMNEGRHILAQVRFYQGDLAAAREIAEHHLRERRALGQQHGIASQLNWLGHISLAEGRTEATRGYYRESLLLREQVEYQVGKAFTVAGCAKFAAALGQHDRAVLLASAACAASEAVGVPARRMLQAGLREQLTHCRAALGERYDSSWAEGARLSLPDALSIAHQTLDLPVTV